MPQLPNESVFSQSTVTYQEVYSAEGSASDMQMHDFVEICILLEGSGIHKLLSEAAECHAGDVFILGSGVPHAFFAKSEREKPTVFSVSFQPTQLFSPPYSQREQDSFCYGVFRDRIPFSYAMLNSKAMEEIGSICQSIAQECRASAMEKKEALRAELILLLIKLARYIHQADTRVHENPKDWAIVSSAMQEVVQHCSDHNMTLESIASGLYVSKSHLSRMFARITGTSFADYVKDVRLCLACRLLQSTNLTNEEIVGRCGLKDIPSFYRLFKAQMGMTPYQYRMTVETNQGEQTMSIYLEISENLQKGRAKLVKELVNQAIEEGLPAKQILNEGLLAGMNIIGEKFKNNEVYVPEVLVAARAMNMGMQLLKPRLAEDGVQATGRVCIGTVQGDLHDIGKNLVKMMMEGKGLEVIDLGTDVSPETFVQTAIDRDCKVICCSALLTTTMDVMADVVKQAQAAGIRDRVKIMVGGAPVTEAFCQTIGADRYTSDAASAADAAVELCSEAIGE